MKKIHSTTILAVIHNGQVAIGGDGQATMGNTIAKSNVKKIRKLQEGKIVTGFAGSTADAFTLVDRFDEKLNSYGGNMKRAAIELAKDWRMAKSSNKDMSKGELIGKLPRKGTKSTKSVQYQFPHL